MSTPRMSTPDARARLIENLVNFADYFQEQFDNKRLARSLNGGKVPDWDCEAITTTLAEQDGVVHLMREAADLLGRAVSPSPDAQQARIEALEEELEQSKAETIAADALTEKKMAESEVVWKQRQEYKTRAESAERQLAEATAKLEKVATLHQQIMNLPSKPKGYGDRPEEWRRGYGFGHKEARHAAAELVGEALASVSPPPSCTLSTHVFLAEPGDEGFCYCGLTRMVSPPPSPVLAFQAWAEQRTAQRGPMTQDEYFLAQEAFYAAHPGKGPQSALMRVQELASSRNPLLDQFARAEAARKQVEKERDALAQQVQALREALADTTAMCRSVSTWPDGDIQGLRYHALERAKAGMAALRASGGSGQ